MSMGLRKSFLDVRVLNISFTMVRRRLFAYTRVYVILVPFLCNAHAHRAISFDLGKLVETCFQFVSSAKRKKDRNNNILVVFSHCPFTKKLKTVALPSQSVEVYQIVFSQNDHVPKSN